MAFTQVLLLCLAETQSCGIGSDLLTLFVEHQHNREEEKASLSKSTTSRKDLTQTLAFTNHEYLFITRRLHRRSNAVMCKMFNKARLALQDGHKSLFFCIFIINRESRNKVREFYKMIM